MNGSRIIVRFGLLAALALATTGCDTERRRCGIGVTQETPFPARRYAFEYPAHGEPRLLLDGCSQVYRFTNPEALQLRGMANIARIIGGNVTYVGHELSGTFKPRAGSSVPIVVIGGFYADAILRDGKVVASPTVTYKGGS